MTRQVQRVKGGGVEITPPKYGSERTVFLADRLVQLISIHVAPWGQDHAASRWLFVGAAGNPPHQNTVGYWWRRTCKAAGVEGVTLHDLRHFFASGLIATGCDVVTVQRALGHRSATVTLPTYAHLWPTAEDRARKAADAMLAEALESGDDSADSVRTKRA